MSFEKLLQYRIHDEYSEKLRFEITFQSISFTLTLIFYLAFYTSNTAHTKESKWVLNMFSYSKEDIIHFGYEQEGIQVPYKLYVLQFGQLSFSL